MISVAAANNRQPWGDRRAALGGVLDDPGNAGRYLELSRVAYDGREMARAATAFALTLICLGRPGPRSAHLFDDRWFLAESRYYLFYFHMPLPGRLRSTDLHWLDRRLAADQVTSSARRRAALSAQTFIPPIDVERPPILLCGMPKSASTFLSHCIGGALGYRVRGAHSVDDGVGTGFDLVNLLRISQPGVVMHSHLPANARTLSYLSVWGIRPIVTVRNIFDALRSYADHIVAAPEFRCRPGVDWRRVAVLRMATHYVDFYASWQRAIARGVPALILHYDALRENPAEATNAALEFVGARAAKKRVVEAVARAREPQHKSVVRYNVGSSGRGSELGADLRALVRSLYALHRDVSFARIDPDAGS